MDGLVMTDMPSLARLKALDTIVGLGDQLREAQQLCSHPARAEMVSRWLFRRLNTSEAARQEPFAWELLSSVLRMLPVRKIAILLSTSTFMELLRKTCTLPALPIQALTGLADLLTMLLDLGHETYAIAVRSALTATSEVATFICGAWFKHVYNACDPLTPKTSHHALSSLLDPPLQLWALRRRTTSDDELFNANCLVPALLLLTLAENAKSPSLNKRKRNGKPSSPSYTSQLESLIATHTILPARTSFWQADRRSREGQPVRRQSTSKTTPTVQERFVALRTAVLDGQIPRLLATLALVLRIAVLCVQTTSPKRRLSERPWIEMLVSVLSSMPDQEDSVTSLLTVILATLRKYNLSLSSQYLSGLLSNRAFIRDQNQGVNWDFVAEIAKMDSHVLTDDVILNGIFCAISSHKSGQCDCAVDEARSEPREDLLKDSIIVPVMKTMIKGRKAREFVEAWYLQLTQWNGSPKFSIWTTIAEDFSNELEEAMSPEEAAVLFETRVRSLGSVSLNETASDTWNTYLANLVQAYSIVRGIRSEENLAHLQLHLDTLLADVIALNNVPKGEIPDVVLYHLYKLTARVIQLSFPYWITRADGDIQTSPLKFICLDSPLVTSATGKCASSECQIGNAAQSFLGTLCDHIELIGQHFKRQDLLVKDVDLLCMSSRRHGVGVILRHPALSGKIDAARWREVFSRLFSDQTVCHDVHKDVLRAVGTASDASWHENLMESAISVGLEELSLRQPRNPSTQMNVLFFFLSVDHTKLTNLQRAAILNSVVQLELTSLNSRDNMHLLRYGLSLIIALLPGAGKDALLLQDAFSICKLALQLHADHAEQSAASMYLENLELLQEITRIITETWLHNKEHEKVHRLVEHLLDSIRIQFGSRAFKDQRDTQICLLAIFKAVSMVSTEKASTRSLTKLMQPNATAIKDLMEAMFKELNSAEQHMQADPDSNGPYSTALLHYVLQFLALLPAAVRSGEAFEKVNNSIHAWASSALLPSASHKESAKSFVSCSQCSVGAFHVLARYGRTSLEDLTDAAKKVLELTLAAKAYSQVLQIYSEAARAVSTAAKLQTLDRLGFELPDRPQALVLYAEVLATMERPEVELTSTISCGSFRSTADLIQPIRHAALKATGPFAKKFALKSMGRVLKEQSQIYNQYNIEEDISWLHNVLADTSWGILVCKDACDIITTLLTRQRARLRGRSHLLVPLLQMLLTSLSKASKKSHLEAAPAGHGARVARLLQTFCHASKPRPKGRATELIDEARKAEAQIGQFAQYVLSHYCGQLLEGSLSDAARETLTPGLWSMIEAIEGNNVDGIKSLSSGMTSGERALLRSLYEGWKMFGKWEGS